MSRDPGTESVFVMERSHPCGVRFRLEFGGPEDAFYGIPNEEIIRFLCHALIERIPARGVEDIWESVQDAWEFYSVPVLTNKDEKVSPFAVRSVYPLVMEEPFEFREE